MEITGKPEKPGKPGKAAARLLSVGLLPLLPLLLAGCLSGGSDSEATSPQAQALEAILQGESGGSALQPFSACEASGLGTDHRVGPGQTYTELEQVPWESLRAGDTVRIFHRAEPYRGKFMLGRAGHGRRAGAGVRRALGRGRAPDDQRQRRGVASGPGRRLQQQRRVPPAASGALADPDQAAGQRGRRLDPGALAHPDRRPAHRARPPRSVLHRCRRRQPPPTRPSAPASGSSAAATSPWPTTRSPTARMGVFSKSTDDNSASVTRDLRLIGNHIHGHGIGAATGCMRPTPRAWAR